jgi:hypothetical protein
MGTSGQNVTNLDAGEFFSARCTSCSDLGSQVAQRVGLALAGLTPTRGPEQW